VDDRVELIGGIEKRDIVIVAYDADWPRRFEIERHRITVALGRRAITVDHIGSTSVPGLPAKPIIDVDLAVADVDDEAAYLPDLLAAGYELRVREPGHRMVRPPQQDVHVHVTTAGTDRVRRDLRFRDRLRADAADRDAYAALKRRLARRDWPDMNAYAEAKGDLIAEILARGEEPPGR
jgi:GrpB-like predicted nucleotidyltransferase (UPF0157 family)